jgi:HSP20 family molecular chaperone IbpA
LRVAYRASMDKLPGDCVRSYSTHRTCSYTISYVMSTRERQSNYKNGLLVVTLPKAEKAKPKQIIVSHSA